MMAQTFDVLAKVIAHEGKCAVGHTVGDEWVIGSTTPQGLCCAAFNSMFWIARVLKFGGSLPASDDPDTGTATCHDGRITFLLKRIRPKE